MRRSHDKLLIPLHFIPVLKLWFLISLSFIATSTNGALLPYPLSLLFFIHLLPFPFPSFKDLPPGYWEGQLWRAPWCPPQELRLLHILPRVTPGRPTNNDQLMQRAKGLVISAQQRHPEWLQSSPQVGRGCPGAYIAALLAPLPNTAPCPLFLRYRLNLFPGDSHGKEPAGKAREPSSIPGLGRSP